MTQCDPFKQRYSKDKIHPKDMSLLVNYTKSSIDFMLERS